MPGLEDVGGGPQVEVQLVDLPRLHQFRLGERLAIAGTQDTIREDLSAAIGVHIDEFAGKVSIACRRGDIQHQFDGASHLYRLL